jgi:hypothetical protein
VSRRFATARGVLLAGVVLLAGPASARELWRSGEPDDPGVASLELSGSLRELFTLTNGTDRDDFAEAASAGGAACVQVLLFPDCPAFREVGGRDVWTSLTRLRLRLDARASERLSAVVVWDQEVRAGILDTFESSLGDGFAFRRFLDLEDEILDREHVGWRQLLYRAYAFYESPKVEVTVGRQRLAWGVGRLWNPIDRFNAIGPLAIEQDQSQGVDAVKIDLTTFSSSRLDAM